MTERCRRSRCSRCSWIDASECLGCAWVVLRTPRRFVFAARGCSRPFVRSAPVLAKTLPKRQTCRAGLLKRLGMVSRLPGVSQLASRLRRWGTKRGRARRRVGQRRALLRFRRPEADRTIPWRADSPRGGVDQRDRGGFLGRVQTTPRLTSAGRGGPAGGSLTAQPWKRGRRECKSLRSCSVEFG